MPFAYDSAVGARTCRRRHERVRGRREIVFRKIVSRIHHVLGPPQRPKQEQRVPRLHLSQPLPQALAPLQIQHGSPPRLAVQLEEPAGTERRLPEEMVHVEMRPAARAQRLPHVIE